MPTIIATDMTRQRVNNKTTKLLTSNIDKQGELVSGRFSFSFTHKRKNIT